MKKPASRPARKPARKSATAQPLEKFAFSIREFCEAHSISIAMFYLMQQRGEGPATMQVGTHQRISREAAERWRRQRENPAT